jgi:hypothetical protein
MHLMLAGRNITITGAGMFLSRQGIRKLCVSAPSLRSFIMTEGHIEEERGKGVNI